VIEQPLDEQFRSFVTSNDGMAPGQPCGFDQGDMSYGLQASRKTMADDSLDSISGSTGFTGAADTILVLSRDKAGVTLFGRGRDVDEIETALKFDGTSGVWSLLGDADDVRRSGERGVILRTASARQPDVVSKA